MRYLKVNGGTPQQIEEMKTMIVASNGVEDLKVKVNRMVESLNECNQQYIDQVDSIFNEIQQEVLLLCDDQRHGVVKKVKIEELVQQNE